MKYRMEGLKAKTGSLYDGEAREIQHVKNVSDLVSKVSMFNIAYQNTEDHFCQMCLIFLCCLSGLVQTKVGWNQGQILTASWCTRAGFGSEKCCKYEQGRNLAIQELYLNTYDIDLVIIMACIFNCLLIKCLSETIHRRLGCGEDHVLPLQWQSRAPPSGQGSGSPQWCRFTFTQCWTLLSSRRLLPSNSYPSLYNKMYFTIHLHNFVLHSSISRFEVRVCHNITKYVLVYGGQMLHLQRRLSERLRL